jgi:hypothetical protein
MKTLKILFVLCIMLGFAATANSQGKQVVRPMKGTFYESPSGTAGTSLVTGHVTHMGNITGTSIADLSQAIWIDNTTLTNVKNSKTKIAANGDKIFSTACVTLKFNLDGNGNKDNTGTFYGTAIEVGGTGRFEGCTGELYVTGTFNNNTGCKEYTVDGWIKY